MKTIQRISGVLLALMVPIFGLIVASALLWNTVGTSIETRLLPQLLSVPLGIVCVIAIARGLTKLKRTPNNQLRDETTTDYEVVRDAPIRVVTTVTILAAYVASIQYVGFYIGTTVFLAAVMFGLGVRGVLRLTLIPVIASIAIYLLFEMFFGVPIPSGLFF